jgi:hypothetical protein
LNIKESLQEVIQSIIPLTLIIFILKLTIIGFTGEQVVYFIIGLILTIIGFTLFIVGAKLSLLPIGNMIGRSLITKGTLWFVLLFGVAVGFAVTVAEPGVLILTEQVVNVSSNGVSKLFLTLSISLGVGIFLGLALLRIVFKIPLIWILFGTYSLVLILSFFVSPEFIAIAFDSGGVTTGPLTVPFILALGVGVTSVMGTRRGTQDNFGLVGLASIGPVLAVLILGVIYG